MKNLLLVSFVQFVFIIYGYAQSDLQWIVNNGIGKDGCTGTFPNQQNNYPTSNTLSGNQFELQGIKHPDRITVLPNKLKKKNDLLIIFSDWSNFNSREKDVLPNTYGLDIFYSCNDANPPNLSNLNHNFQNNYNRNIGYIYQTNLYEDDDLPDGVKVINGSNGHNTSSILIGKNSAINEITANHNVVYQKDITLIVCPKKGLDTTDHDPFIDIYMRCEGSDDAEDGGIYFNTSDIFNINIRGASQNHFSNVPFASKEGNRIYLPARDFVGECIYINLRPSEEILSYINLPPGGSISSVCDTIGLADFSFFNGDNTSSNPDQILTEQVLLAPDSNFIMVDNICLTEDGNTVINYYLQFKNDGNTPPGNVKVTFELPDYMKIECIKNAILFSNYVPISGGRISIDNSSNSVTVYFPEGSIGVCTPVDPKSCVGGIRFCVELEDEMDIHNSACDLKPINPLVYFGSAFYPIKKFIDKSPILHKSGYRREISNELCSCSCSNNKWKVLLPGIIAISIIIILFIIWWMRNRW